LSATLASLLAASGLPPLEAQVLAAHALGVSRARLLADSQRPLDADAVRGIERLFLRRRAGEPVAYLTGEREFHGLSLKVTPDVLIPRPETELLVELALERLPNRAGRVVDLGTGSGAIAAAIAHAAPDAEVFAVDSSAAALAVARENARRHSASIRFVESEWFAGLAGERFDLVVSNPPYLAEGEAASLAPELGFEPRTALFAGPRGDEVLVALVEGARAALAPGGGFALEIAPDQAGGIRALCAERGLEEVRVIQDLAGRARVVAARAPGQGGA
jgi:release factor glutamine methyltransferase